jgi:hypothetical protein
VRALRGLVRPGFYTIVTLVLGMLTSMGIAVYVSVSASNRAIHQAIAIEQRRQADERAQAAAGRAASCKLINTVADAEEARLKTTRENAKAAGLPPPSDAVAKVWRDLAKFC